MRRELLNVGSAKVCFHHELKVGSVFERQIYSTDTKTVKGGHKITFEMAKMLDAKDIQSMPGFQLCRLCFEEAQTHCHDVSEVEDYDIAIASDWYSSEAEEDPCEKHPKKILVIAFNQSVFPPSKPTASQNMSKSHMHLRRSVKQ